MKHAYLAELLEKKFIQICSVILDCRAARSGIFERKSSAQPLNFDWMWLVNEIVLTFSAPIKCTKAQFNLIILSRVMPHTTDYRQTDRQTLS